MSKLIIPVKDPFGNTVYFESSEHEGKDLVANYPMYRQFLISSGFTLVTPQEPITAPTPVSVPTVNLPDLTPVDLGVCRKCKAPNKMAKSGNVYCSNTCWLKK